MKIRKATEADHGQMGKRKSGKWTRVVDQILKDGPVVISEADTNTLRTGLFQAAKARGYKASAHKVDGGFLCSLKKLPS